MTTQALTVLAVSLERSVLRRLHRLLSAFGYRVQTLADPARAFDQIESVVPHFLILDLNVVNASYDAIRQLRKQRSFAHSYTLLLCHDQSEINVVEALEAGVDDFLEKPVNSAEVLARLRAGARFLEFERRAGAFLQTDPVTGLLTRESFLDVIRPHGGASGDQADQHGCVFLEVDSFDAIRHSHGWSAEQKILQGVAETIRKQGGDAVVATRWEGARFCVMLPDASIDDVAKWGERIGLAVAERTDLSEREADRITVSMGVGAFRLGSGPIDQALRKVAHAAQAAVESGGNCLVRVGDFEEERDQWLESLHNGNPFSGAKARDAMTPFSYCLNRDQTVGDATAKLDRLHVGMLPVVDSDHRILGLVRVEDLQPDSSRPVRPTDSVDSIMSNDFVSVEEDSSFASVMKHLFDNRECRVVVVRNEIPQGLITFRALSALAEPLSVDSFSAAESFSHATLEGLLVPAPEIGESKDGKTISNKDPELVASASVA